MAAELCGMVGDGVHLLLLALGVLADHAPQQYRSLHALQQVVAAIDILDL